MRRRTCRPHRRPGRARGPGGPLRARVRRRRDGRAAVRAGSSGGPRSAALGPGPPDEVGEQLVAVALPHRRGSRGHRRDPLGIGEQRHDLLAHPAGRDSGVLGQGTPCLLYTSDAADEEDSVDLGGRRIIKKKKLFEASLYLSLYHSGRFCKFILFFFSSRRRHTRFMSVSWARRCV